jgi:hypothetical protein
MDRAEGTGERVGEVARRAIAPRPVLQGLIRLEYVVMNCIPFRVTVLGVLAMSGAAANAERVYAVTANNTLISWNASDPTTILSGVAISGLGVNEPIRGIDFRPATGKLFLLGGFSNLYQVALSSGAATKIGPGFAGPGTTLNGSSFGFDFNPTIDRIRVVSEADQNLVLNPDTGGATAATTLFYGPGDPNEGRNPNVVGSAYSNNFAGATTSQLYGIDTGLDMLVTQANSLGRLGTVGALGFDVNDSASFDISGLSGSAYMTVQNVALSRSTFWSVDLMSGQASMIGEVGGGAMIVAMSVVPAPGALAVFGVAALGARRRR